MAWILRAARGYSDRFTALMRFQAQRAHALFDEGTGLLPKDERRDQKTGLMMAHIYRALLRGWSEVSRCCTSASRSHRCASSGSPCARTG